jgi:hypothetical protein
MTHFTPDVFKPSEKTLRLIKQLAYTYRAKTFNDGSMVSFCLN